VVVFLVVFVVALTKDAVLAIRKAGTYDYKSTNKESVLYLLTYYQHHLNEVCDGFKKKHKHIKKKFMHK